MATMGRDQSQAVVRKTEAVIADACLPCVVKVAVELTPEVLPVTQGMSAPEARPGSKPSTKRFLAWNGLLAC